MSSPAPAWLTESIEHDQWLTVSEAREILEHPVFGDPTCIKARKLLVLCERVSKARAEGWTGNRRLDYMTGNDLRGELNNYFAQGYKEAEDE